ncbi:P-loop containing nucleoside triphosphate hydrolase protein [Flagelloscypha sp. PMI_526]|nr:P-loop containing nucleoside triphosphate hydrolase protein [Flagelloscypha sp. PMI_526]
MSTFWLEHNHFGRPVAAFTKGPGIVLPEHKFYNGSQILVSLANPLEEEPLRGSVISSSATQLRVVFNEKFEDFEERPGLAWRLDLGRNDISFLRMRAALQALTMDPTQHESEVKISQYTVPANKSPSGKEETIVKEQHFALVGTRLRDLLLTSWAGADTPLLAAPTVAASMTSESSLVATLNDSLSAKPSSIVTGTGSFAQNHLIASWAHRYAAPGDPIVIPGDPDVSMLNKSQIRAVAMMLGNRASLVQGPPGTGKTKTIIEAIRILKVHFQVPHPLLVCTYTNVAVDNLVEGFVKAGLNPVRVGSVSQRQEGNGQAGKDDSEYAEVNRDAREVEIQVARMSSCTTCITSASVDLKIIDFPVVFLDEASMSTEPASLIPIMKGCEHLALIGDHKQLPPVITLNIECTLAFPSSLPPNSIHRALLDGTVSASGIIAPHLCPPVSSHLISSGDSEKPSVVFLDHESADSLKDRSRVNKTEALIVASVVEDLLLHNPTLQGHDIGIIAPYAAQINHLIRLFRTDPEQEIRFREVLGDARAMQMENIEIKTVDGGYIGFLADERRLNVGLTRAKRGLFVIGSIKTLKEGKMAEGRKLKTTTMENGKVEVVREKPRVGKGAESWRNYAKWLMENDLVVTLQGQRLEDTLGAHFKAARDMERQTKRVQRGEVFRVLMAS